MRPALGDTVRLPTGDEGRVTGTMTLRVEDMPGAPVRRSVCVMTPSGPPVWISVEDVVVVARTARS